MRERATGREGGAGLAQICVLRASWLDEPQRLIWSVVTRGLSTTDLLKSFAACCVHRPIRVVWECSEVLGWHAVRRCSGWSRCEGGGAMSCMEQTCFLEATGREGIKGLVKVVCYMRG